MTTSVLDDADYWRALNPSLSVDGAACDSGGMANRSLAVSESELISAQVRENGFFKLTELIPTATTIPLAAAVCALVARRLPPIFLAIYDEFWGFIQSLGSTFESVLGADYLVRPDFWIWHVDCGPEHRGWRPHRDAPFLAPLGRDSFVRLDGTARMCTLWIALTDATLQNSCIHVLPKSRDPQFKAFMAGLELPWIQALGARIDLRQAEALPVSAGSVLGWVPYLLHWGGQSTSAARHPRISIGLYCAASDLLLPDSADLLVHPREFFSRRRLIANLIEKYRKSGHLSEPGSVSPEILSFARRWSG